MSAATSASEERQRTIDAGSAATGATLRVVRGAPTAEEIAALVVVLAARTGGTPGPAYRGGSSWARYWRTVRGRGLPGPGAWRASARPR